MEHVVGTTGWVAESEHVLSGAERDREREFRSIDSRVGDVVALAYGDATDDPRPLPVYMRYPLAAVRKAAASPIGNFARRLARRSERETWRIRHCLSSRVAIGGPVSDSIEVVSFPEDAETGNGVLDRTQASHLVLVRAGAELSSSGLHAIRRALEHDPGAELLYGDSRRRNGVRFRAPAFSPLRLREEDYLGPVVVVSVATLRERGGFRPSADGAEVLDVALRTEPTAAHRLRDVLGVGEPIDRPQGGFADAAERVVRDLLAERGVSATVTTADGLRTVDYEVEGDPLVSIIIPTRGSAGAVADASRTFVVEAVRDILERSTWRDTEVVVVADDETPQTVIDELVEVGGDRLVLIRWSEPFNFSAKMNRGAAVARGDYLLMLNDDVDVVTPDWIERMLALAQQEGVGMVGAMLYFEDGAIQHLGHIHQGGGAGHVGFGVIPGAFAPIAELMVTREVSGVTAACALLPAEVFRAVGGFSVLFPGNYNDVDLSLKVREEGFSIVCTGSARLYHFESRTRDAKVLPSEFAALRRRWQARTERDEYSRELEG